MIYKFIPLLFQHKMKRGRTSPIPTHHFLGGGPSGTDQCPCDNVPHGRSILSFAEIGLEARLDETAKLAAQEEKSDP